MGTYTTNKELFMPTVGEQGWGTLVNGNFETIDTFLKPISLSGSNYTFTGNHVGNQSGGSISATSITNSGTLTNTGTLTCTGKIYADGGIEVTGTIIGTNSYTVSYGNDNVNPYSGASNMMFYVLPYELNTTYSGSLQIRNMYVGVSTISPYYYIVTDSGTTQYEAPSVNYATPHTITFTNIRALFVSGTQSAYKDYFRISKPILS